MSMAAWPSMDPASPLSACSRAAVMVRLRTNSRNATAISTIMIGSPANSAKVNCQEISSAKMMPSSITQVGPGDLESHRGSEAGTSADQSAGQRHGGVGA